MIALNRHISVLLVEDSLSDAQLILQPNGVRTNVGALPLVITLAVRLDQAMQMLRASQFDVILLDLSLPDADGMDGVITIGAEFPELPIVVLTGNDQLSLPSEALQSGAQDYLLKDQISADLINRSLRFAIERKKCDSDLKRLFALEQREMFMAMLAHDLKNPVLGLKRILELLLEDKAGPVSAEQRSLFRVMNSSNRQLLDIINNVLDCHQLDSNAHTKQLAFFDLSAVVKDCLTELQFESDVKQMVISNFLPDRQMAYGDAIAMRRVVNNLVSNALKFSPKGAMIQLSSESSPGRIQLKITNTGVQIPVHHRNKLFQPFYQTQSEDRTRGLGLGLHICQTMLRSQGGDIDIEGDESNSTTFVVNLPASTVA